MNEKVIIKFAEEQTEIIKSIMNYFGVTSSEVTFMKEHKTDFIKMANDKNFFYSKYEGPLKELHDNIPHVDTIAKQDLNLFTTGRKRVTEFIHKKKANLLGNLVIADWLVNKQVFEFSDELLQALIDTDASDLSSQMLEHLPFNTFCIDLSENSLKSLNKKVGLLLISIIPFGDVTKIYTVQVDKNGNVLNMVGMNVSDEPPEGFEEKSVIKGCSIEKNIPDTKNIMLEVIISILMYLSSDKPDIRENEISKKRYRKPSSSKHIKNKPREIQKWDVGYRYAASIKKYRQQNNSSLSVNENSNSGSKKPHIRKAHWHHYWTGARGSANRKLVLRWIDSCLVNVQFESDLPVVSHKEK